MSALALVGLIAGLLLIAIGALTLIAVRRRPATDDEPPVIQHRRGRRSPISGPAS